jgi:hypothetical protein
VVDGTARAVQPLAGVDAMTSPTCRLRGLVQIAVLGLAACASGVTRHEAPSAKVEQVRALASFSVALAPKAQQQLPDNVKFDIEALRSTLQRTLDAKGMMAKDGDFDLRVLVDDIRVRSTFNAVMWGFMAGDDHLDGTATVLRRDGSTAGSFAVKTSYALGGFAGGIDQTRMTWLYEEFSTKVAEELIARRDATP